MSNFNEILNSCKSIDMLSDIANRISITDGSNELLYSDPANKIYKIKSVDLLIKKLDELTYLNKMNTHIVNAETRKKAKVILNKIKNFLKQSTEKKEGFEKLKSKTMSLFRKTRLGGGFGFGLLSPDRDETIKQIERRIGLATLDSSLSVPSDSDRTKAQERQRKLELPNNNPPNDDNLPNDNKDKDSWTNKIVTLTLKPIVNICNAVYNFFNPPNSPTDATEQSVDATEQPELPETMLNNSIMQSGSVAKQQEYVAANSLQEISKIFIAEDKLFSQFFQLFLTPILDDIKSIKITGDSVVEIEFNNNIKIKRETDDKRADLSYDLGKKLSFKYLKDSHKIEFTSNVDIRIVAPMVDFKAFNLKDLLRKENKIDIKQKLNCEASFFIKKPFESGLEAKIDGKKLTKEKKDNETFYIASTTMSELEGKFSKG